MLAFRKDNIKLLLAEQGFIPLLFVALQKHPRDECVQEQGLAALCTLAANKGNFCTSTRTRTNTRTLKHKHAHICSRLFVALQKHPRHECVQEQGLTALCTLTANKGVFLLYTHLHIQAHTKVHACARPGGAMHTRCK